MPYAPTFHKLIGLLILAVITTTVYQLESSVVYQPAKIYPDLPIALQTNNPNDYTAADSSQTRLHTTDNNTTTPQHAQSANDRSYTEEPATEPTQAAASSSTPAATAPNLITEYLLDATTIRSNTGQTYSLRSYAPALTPNDPLANQWWESSLNLEEAWDTTTGSSDTLLAIIDTGFGLDHEEFSGRWHENTGERGTTASESSSLLNCTDQSIALDQSCNRIDDNFDGIVDNETGTTSTENQSLLNCTDQARTLDKSCNLIDDDGNGFIDDHRGWDFVSFDNSPQAGEIDPFGAGTRHGTYVASAAAANANNGVGIAGVNWETKVLPLQALSDSGSGNSLSVARSIRYAVDQGADVISLSLGGAFPDPFLRLTITEAIEAGVIVVAAAGNDGCDCISYPGNYQEVITVGALTQSNTPASFSSYGSNLDILAPGVGLHTASWTASNPTNAYASGISGTSLATPLVSATLATLKGQLPEASSQELVALLLETTDRLTLPTSHNRSDSLGFGTADTRAATTRAVTSHTTDNKIILSNVYHGTYFSGPPFELQSTELYLCEPGSYGSSALYRVNLGSQLFYSSSQSESAYASNIGYTSQLVSHFCTTQHHDAAAQERTIDVLYELDNIYTKPE